MKLILIRARCCRRCSVHAARGLINMINCQSVQFFEWLVVGDYHNGWWTFTVLGWLQAWWTPYQNGHRTQLLQSPVDPFQLSLPLVQSSSYVPGQDAHTVLSRDSITGVNISCHLSSKSNPIVTDAVSQWRI